MPGWLSQRFCLIAVAQYAVPDQCHIDHSRGFHAQYMITILQVKIHFCMQQKRFQAHYQFCRYGPVHYIGLKNFYGCSHLRNKGLSGL